MRKLFDTDDHDNAERFGNYLNSIGIESELRDMDEKWSLWVYDEDRIPEAQRIKSEFLADPFHKKYDVKFKKAPEKAPPKPKGAKYVDVRSEVFDKSSSRSTPVVTGIIFICTLLFLASMSPNYSNVTRWLYFSQYMGRDFFEISQGQVWRLVTPIFLHGGFLHVLFNMMWLFDLGGQMERIAGSWRFLLFVLVTAIICNTSQYLISGANFVGMSGVVYALLGFIWTMGRFAKRTRYVLHDQTMMFMMAWLFICFFLPNVANAEHVMGLLTGSAWGFLKAKRS